MAFELKRAGKKDKAIKYYEKALEIDPENIAAMNDLANIWSDLGAKDKAMKYHLYLTKMQPDTVEGWINLGVYYQILAIWWYSVVVD